MHSFRTTHWMANAVLNAAAKRGAIRVARIEVDLGKLVCFSPAQVENTFDLLFEDTIADNAEIRINIIDPEIKCLACGRNGVLPMKESEEFSIPIASLMCPDCGSTDIEIVKGKECKVTQVGMVMP